MQFSLTKLVKLLDISITTARRLQRGETDLRRGEARFLQLTLDRRIMPDHWPLNITFEPDDTLHLSRYNLTWGQLEHYSWVCMQWGETLRRVDALQAYVDDVIEMMTQVQQVKALHLRTLMIESVNTGKPYEVIKKA